MLSVAVEWIGTPIAVRTLTTESTKKLKYLKTARMPKFKIKLETSQNLGPNFLLSDSLADLLINQPLPHEQKLVSAIKNKKRQSHQP